MSPRKKAMYKICEIENKSYKVISDFALRRHRDCQFMIDVFSRVKKNHIDKKA